MFKDIFNLSGVLLAAGGASSSVASQQAPSHSRDCTGRKTFDEMIAFSASS